MNKSTPNTLQSTNISPAKRYFRESLEATGMEALQQRIATLEEELVHTKVQLAQAKSSEDKMKIELAKATDALANDTGKDDAMDTSVPEGTSDGDEAAGSGNEKDQREHTTVTVTTADPFSRKRKERVALNPNSCASGINLMNDLQTSLSSALSSNSSFANLLGRRRRLSTTLSSLRNGSRNNARVGNDAQQHERSGSQNAEWDSFE